MIEKTYQSSQVEGRIYDTWEKAAAFRAGRPERAGAAPYSIVIPPPNVTGSLHMGHALNNTLQDILCRFERMRGKDVLWQPGTDHAGIATQAVVERRLMEQQRPGSREMGRPAFIEEVWKWKAESGGTIIGQLKRLGASCDWSRERFTMDEGLSKAVLKVFVALYRDGLIYKDKRLVNWDPKLLTAISDLEVQQIEIKGHLWHFRYPLEGKTFNPEDASTFITVATTRPETMLGDTAVAVHPDDDRYKQMVGKNAILPLVGRRIKIVADDYSDPEKGSGAVKITPAHDFNDFDVGKRHSLPLVNILTPTGKLYLEGNLEFLAHLKDEGNPSEAGLELATWTLPNLDGLDRFAARKKIVERMEERGLVEKIEPHTHMVPHGDRSNAVIEPYLTDQWYVDAKTLAKPAIAAVRAGKTQFVPKNWEKTYYDWMENIQPWCISRQIWWGHQIPAWYGFELIAPTMLAQDQKAIFVAETVEEAREQAKRHYGTDVVVLKDDSEVARWIEKFRSDEPLTQYPIMRDPDVLDTWFSSALWPFSTLGWPDKTPELARFYPTSALVTGFDIIFFWVARMMMMGLHFMNKERPGAPSEQIVPFKDVYIHALVRDASGAKMSKSKGNVIDPLALIDEYGADALRFTLAAMAAQGRDIKLSTQRVEGYRNFATKLWNAARFAEMNDCRLVETFDVRTAKETINRWIVHWTANAVGVTEKAITDYKFNEAAANAYAFVWNIYCDWYLELAKPVLVGPDTPAKAETRATVAWVRDQILKLLHPFMPFITEELWGVTERREQMLALTAWPKFIDEFHAKRSYQDADAETEIGWLIEIVVAIRSIRSEMNIKTSVPLVLVNPSDYTRERAQNWGEYLKRAANVSEISVSSSVPAGAAQVIVRDELAALPLKGVIDVDAERARLEKEMAKVDTDMKRIDAQLSNPNFLARAAEEKVELERERLEEATARRAKITEALERLKGAA